ncbi:MAG: helix-turn-helix domain-containing protein [Hyphomicrobiales bacterium]|nr:helix-turn-helix domain-containing protein [Hyphomicrobiales bacterium]
MPQAQAKSGDWFETLLSESDRVRRAQATVELVNEAAGFMRRARERAGLKQAQLAQMMGVTQARIAQLESGKPGNAPALAHIADYMFFCGGAESFGLRSAEADSRLHEEADPLAARRPPEAASRVKRKPESGMSPEERLLRAIFGENHPDAESNG